MTSGQSCSEHIPNQDAAIGTHADHLLAVGTERHAGDGAAVSHTFCEKRAVRGVPYAHALVRASGGKKTPAIRHGYASGLEVAVGIVGDEHGAGVREVPK